MAYMYEGGPKLGELFFQKRRQYFIEQIYCYTTFELDKAKR